MRREELGERAAMQQRRCGGGGANAAAARETKKPLQHGAASGAAKKLDQQSGGGGRVVVAAWPLLLSLSLSLLRMDGAVPQPVLQPTGPTSQEYLERPRLSTTQ